MNSDIIMYQTEDGLTKIESTFDGDTDGKTYQVDYIKALEDTISER